MNADKVSERLCAFLRDRMEHGVPDEVLHEAKRLLLNQLKASVSASTQLPPKVLHDWALSARPTAPPMPGQAQLLWSGATTLPAQAAIVNGASFALLDFDDTHIGTRMSATSAVLAAVLAQAEASGHDGRDLLTALVLGVEMTLVCAALAPHSADGPRHLAQVASVGAAAACGVLAGLSTPQLRSALAWAAHIAPGGARPASSNARSEADACLTGLSARAGIEACEWAQRGLVGPDGALDTLLGRGDSPGAAERVLAELGDAWRLFDIAYHTMPAEALLHAPIECVLALWPRARGRSVANMRFSVAPAVAAIDKARRAAGTPVNDLRLYLAAAWPRGQFTAVERERAVRADASLLAIGSRIDLVADPARQRIDGCALYIEFNDGSSESFVVDEFLGSPGRPLTDSQLSELFREAADLRLSPTRAGEILHAVWGLHAHPDMHVLMSLLRSG